MTQTTQSRDETRKKAEALYEQGIRAAIERNENIGKMYSDRAI